MNNIIKKFNSLLKIRDEICGEWITEDGSGFSIIMGSWIEFKKDGNGKYESWSNSGEETEYYNIEEFKWKRIGKKTIQIQENGSEKIELIKYNLTKSNGRIELTSSQPELEKFGIEAFWHFAQVLFKK